MGTAPVESLSATYTKLSIDPISITISRQEQILTEVDPTAEIIKIPDNHIPISCISGGIVIQYPLPSPLAGSL